MDPFTLMLAALGGGGKLLAGFAGSAAAELQGKIAAGNTRLLDQQAEIDALGAPLARARGTFEQSRLGDRVRRTLAADASSFVARGLDPTVGSPLVRQFYSAAQGQADAEIVQAGEALEASNALTQSANTRAKAAASRWQQVALNEKGVSDMLAGIFGAATSFLSVGKGFGGGDAGGGFYGGSPDSNPLLRPY